MGISGLLPFLKEATEPIHIKKYAGQAVAVDTYCWIHKGSFACADKLAKKERTDQYVKYCLKYIDMLERFRVKPILVFDGCRLPSKELVEQERHNKRKQNLDKGKQLLREGNVSAARDCFTKCVSVTPAMALEVIEAARAKGIDCIVAPYEADAQLAYFSKHGIAQAIITEDSDLLCFGCKKVVYKMDLTGRAQEVTVENLKAVKNLADFTPDSFRHMCILAGCDYLSSVKGVGLAKACKALKASKSKDGYQVAKKLHQYIKLNAPVKPSYGSDFVRADQTFLYQLIFNPLTRKLQPLNEYPPDTISADLKFAGPYMPDDKAFQIALGNIDVNTRLVVGHFDLDSWIMKRKPLDNLPSIWVQKNVRCNKYIKRDVVPQLSATIHDWPLKEKVPSLSADEVLKAVVKKTFIKDSTDSSTQISRLNKKSWSVNADNMSELLSSYNSNQKSDSKVQNVDREKIPSRRVVKSRFFASRSNLDSSKESIDCIPESELSNLEQDSRIDDKTSCEDAALNSILSEISTQTNKECLDSSLKRKNPFSRSNNSSSQLRKVINSSGDSIDKFSNRRKKKKLILPSLCIGEKQSPLDHSDNFADEAIPFLDEKRLDIEENLFDSQQYSSSIEANLCRAEAYPDNHVISNENIPILDEIEHTGGLLLKSLPKAAVIEDGGCDAELKISPIKSEPILIDHSPSDNNVQGDDVVQRPCRRRLGLPKRGHFKSPVKLNLSKYFSGSKASGLRNSKKKSTNKQPSITSFFRFNSS